MAALSGACQLRVGAVTLSLMELRKRSVNTRY